MAPYARRLAVVVQADFQSGRIDDAILVTVTEKRFGSAGTEVQLDPAKETGAGLSKVCYASCKNVLTRDQGIVGPAIGYLSDAVMRQIENCLKTLLELP